MQFNLYCTSLSLYYTLLLHVNCFNFLIIYFLYSCSKYPTLNFLENILPLHSIWNVLKKTVCEQKRFSRAVLPKTF